VFILFSVGRIKPLKFGFCIKHLQRAAIIFKQTGFFGFSPIVGEGTEFGSKPGLSIT